MKILLVWPDKGQGYRHLLSELEKNNHKVVYFVGSESADEFAPAGSVFHFVGDAMNGRPAQGIDDSEFLPPGTDLLGQIYRTESLVLTMLNNRVPMNVISLDEINSRKHFYYHMVRYWSGVLEKYKPDAVILSYIPHNSYDFIIYSLAKILGIKVLTFVDTRIPGRTLPISDIFSGSEWLVKELGSLGDEIFKSEDLPADIRGYFEKITRKDFNEAPPNLRFLKKKYSLFHPVFISKILASIKDGTIFRKGYGYIWWKLGGGNYRRWFKKLFAVISGPFRNNLEKEYQRVQIEPDFSRKFVYVALQVQPECSTSPQGDIFVDQILMLETLSASIPDDWVIYVKEHPLQWIRFGLDFSNYKNRGYYGRVSEVKKVRVVPVATDSYRLIKESQAVATASGAPGWEATLWGKPALIFGYPWYVVCPEVLPIKDVKTCKEAIAKISSGFLPDRNNIIRYLKGFESGSIRGYRAPSAGAGSDLSYEDSVKNLTSFIISELPKL